MAKKVKKMYSLDGKIADQFMKICRQKDIDYSRQIEILMEGFIARDGEKDMDNLYAPRIAGLVSREIEGQVSRLAGMIHKVHIDSTATLYALPALHKKSMEAQENLLNDFLHEQLLNPHRVSAAQHFEFSTDGAKIIQNVRNYARNDIQKQRKQKEQTEADAQ